MMFVVSNLLFAIAKVLRVLINVEIVFIIISAILSWIPTLRYNPIAMFFHGMADIVLKPLRRIIPPIGMVDITPFIAILILIFLDSFVVQTLLDLALRLR